MAEIAFRVEVDLELLQTHGIDKRADPLGPAAVLGNRRDDQPAVEVRLQAVERGHLLEAGLAPGRPQIDDNGLALEIGQARRLPVGIGETGLWRWLRRRRRDKLAGPYLFVCRRRGHPEHDEEHEESGAEPG